MTTPPKHMNRHSLLRCAWLPLLLLAALAAPRAQGAQAVGDFINITSVVPTAQESAVVANIRNGVLAITRTGDTTNPLTVNFSVASVDATYTSYTVISSGANFTYTPNNPILPTQVPATDGPGIGSVDIPAGVALVTISIVPVDNDTVNGAELINVIITPDANYQFNGNAEASIVIAEGDLNLTVSLPVAIAYKQQIPGFLFDPNSDRRGVIAATFNTPTIENDLALSPFPVDLPVFPTVPGAISKFMGAQFSGTAVNTADYTLSYRITGINPTVGSNAWTTESPGPGFGTSRTGSTATGYNVVSYLRGYLGPISLLTPAQVVGGTGRTTILTGDLITFSDDPASIYQVTNLTSAGLFIAYQGLTGIGLQSNLHNGSTITDVGQTNVVGYAVDAPYITGTLQMNVENGFNGFHYGDAFQISGNNPSDTAYYVCTGFAANSYLNAASVVVQTADGVLSFTPYDNAPLAGLNVAIVIPNLPIVTQFPVTLTASGQTGSIVIPDRSTQIQFAVTPIDSGTPTGMRTVTAQLIGNSGFNLNNPAQATVEIADDASIANVNGQSDATSPNVGGSFLVTFTSAFPVPITIPYTIITGPGTPATIGTDYIISGLTALPGAPQTGFGSVVLPVGATTVTIPVTPISTLSAPETVTISLSPSLDYLLASGTTSSVNPTATINILPSLGTIGVSNATPAGITPTISVSTTALAAPANCGVFAITNATTPLPSVPILVDFAISSTATLGVDYQVLDSSFNILKPTGGSNPVFQATIPANGSTVLIYIQPLYDPAAASSFTVNAAILAGQAYQQSSIQASLTIVVVPQTVTAAAGSDASVGAGTLTTNFTITSTNPGSPVTVAFSFPAAAGDASYGTDFTATFNPANIVTPGPTLGTFVATFGASSQLSIELVGLSDPATSYPLPVVLQVDSGTGYQLVATPNLNGSTLTTTVPPTLIAQVNLQQNAAVLLGQNKPTPGLYNSGSGGCGNGSGVATLFGLALAMAALTVVRRRR
jgi:hypothetical protein